MSITYKSIAKKKAAKLSSLLQRVISLRWLTAVPRSKWYLTRQFLAANFKILKLKQALTLKNQKSATY